MLAPTDVRMYNVYFRAEKDVKSLFGSGLFHVISRVISRFLLRYTCAYAVYLLCRGKM